MYVQYSENHFHASSQHTQAQSKRESNDAATQTNNCPDGELPVKNQVCELLNKPSNTATLTGPWRMRLLLPELYDGTLPAMAREGGIEFDGERCCAQSQWCRPNG